MTTSGTRDVTLINKLPCNMTIYWVILKEDTDDI
jgi:hypothetical protein